MRPSAEIALAMMLAKRQQNSRNAAELPEEGSGAGKTLERLLELSAAAGGNTAGPKCFHFVIGGSTPAALAADLLATAYDAITYTWVLSPVGVQMELQALDWLKELFGLPRGWAGVMVTGQRTSQPECVVGLFGKVCGVKDRVEL